ncbi:syntaxin-124-like protein [Gossypium australe]|uniref:Syntaxin-124-like protein n=1 Tax=Gossypium australe TaxID=47621 RepID=A0A5B6V0A3_9ROSI|nr:syntaxin-124-like protein [Gossypium australe]
MNDMFSSSFNKYSNLKQQVHLDDVEAGEEIVNLDNFFEDVDNVKDDIRVVEQIYNRLQESNEETKTAHSAKAMKDLRARMDSDVKQLLKRKLPASDPGSSAYRTRTSLVSGLGRQKAAEEMIENLIERGESETLFEKAIQEQGRGQIVDTISEIQERHDAIQEIEKGMIELHQLFLDMAILVEAQGYQLNDIESNVARASSFVMRGADQLELAKEYQKSSKKWGCIALAITVFLLVIILFPVLSSILIKNA